MNGILFVISIGVFLWILIDNVLHPHPHGPPENIPISSTIPDNPPPLPKKSCPSTSGGPRWAQWVPRAYQQTNPFICNSNLTLCICLSNALWVYPIRDGSVQNRSFLIGENEAKRAMVAHRHFIAWKYRIFLRVRFYTMLTDGWTWLWNSFFFLTRVGCVLVFNNLMVFVSKPSWQKKKQSLVLTLSFECATLVPWFGFGSVSFYTFLHASHTKRWFVFVHNSPFHASLGIATCRMLIHLRKFASENFEVETDSGFLPTFAVESAELSPWKHTPRPSLSSSASSF